MGGMAAVSNVNTGKDVEVFSNSGGEGAENIFPCWLAQLYDRRI